MAKFMNYELFTLIVFFTITNGTEFRVCQTNIIARRLSLEGANPKLNSNEVKVGKSRKVFSVSFHIQNNRKNQCLASFCLVYLKVRKSQKKIVVSLNTPITKYFPDFCPKGLKWVKKVHYYTN